jgi:integrase
LRWWAGKRKEDPSKSSSLQAVSSSMLIELASSVENWRGQTSFPGSKDWVFASPLAVGEKPYWPDAVLKRHIFPAAKRAGITKRIGWHSFRRTLATLLQSSGASVKTTQELMRHSSPVMTLGTYAKAVTADKRLAQNAIAACLWGSLGTRRQRRHKASRSFSFLTNRCCTQI